MIYVIEKHLNSYAFLLFVYELINWKLENPVFKPHLIQYIF